MLSSVIAHGDKKKGVTYDGRSLIINGKRELLFSGSIHYPRSTPEMWPELIQKAKRGGLNVIQTYVFWNIHEPEQGKFNFEGPYDLVKFIKTIGENGMSATIRLGPFIQAEWNHGYESTPCFLLLIIAYFILLHTPLYVYLSYTLFSM
ncbi:hypothetical protein NC652_011729 [Populus alba x Populus x berolinensis]|uniref:beta-galactosidase n=1 Tax=Populus alba x Populus x berolinensis TaxID=444605 RepID=A0AAD6W6W7_9ROSI|nr:hypothetical protein NC652_011729 [Populus alba x Populus x berolinensis]KAJ7001477.1 hypothetical protein NC653_011787 [Populus alba x Populus x berolinensis]